MTRFVALTVGVLVLAWGVSVEPTEAQTIEALEHTQNRLISDALPLFGQTIDPPSGVYLASFRFKLSVIDNTPWSAVAQVYEIPDDYSLVPPIWTSPVIQITGSEIKDFYPNVELDGSKTYGLLIHKTSPGVAGSMAFGADTYADGSFVSLSSLSKWTPATGSDMYFSATFSSLPVPVAAPDPAAVPTLSEWSMIGLMTVLALGGGWAIRRRLTA